MALAGNRDLYYRSNVKEDYPAGATASGNSNEGTHWVRLEQPKDKKIIFKQVGDGWS